MTETAGAALPGATIAARMPGRTYEVVATLPNGIPVSQHVTSADLDRVLRRLGMPFRAADLDQAMVPVIVDIWPSWEAQRLGGDRP